MGMRMGKVLGASGVLVSSVSYASLLNIEGLLYSLRNNTF